MTYKLYQEKRSFPWSLVLLEFAITENASLSGCRSVFTCEQRLHDSILLVHLTGVVLLDYLLDAWGLSDLGCCAPSPGLIVLRHLEDP